MDKEIEARIEKFLQDQQSKQLARLRDEFAMAALGGLLANHEVITSIGKNPRNAKINWGDAVAYEDYILADAMLAAREGK